MDDHRIDVIIYSVALTLAVVDLELFFLWLRPILLIFLGLIVEQLLFWSLSSLFSVVTMQAFGINDYIS